MKEITYILVLLLILVSCSQKPKSEAIVQKTAPIEQNTDTDTLQRFVEKLFCEIVPKHKANELSHTYLTHDFEKLIDEYYSDDMNNDIWTICSDRSKLKYEVGKVQRLSADSAFLDIVWVTSLTMWQKFYSYSPHLDKIDYFCGCYVTDGSI